MRRARLVKGGDAPIFDEDVVECDDDFTIDVRPVVRVGGFDDDVAVQAHVQAVVLADVWVVPVQAGVREPEPVGELAADLDRRLRLERHPVVGVVEPQAVPVDGRFGVAVVADVHDDFGSLPHPQRRTGDRAVVGQHANAVVAEVLGDGRDAQFVAVAVVECDDGGPDRLGEPGDVGREGGGHVGRVVGGVVHDASTVSGSSGRRSSGMAMGANALTSAPPVLPTGYLPVIDPGAATMIRKS